MSEFLINILMLRIRASAYGYWETSKKEAIIHMVERSLRKFVIYTRSSKFLE